MLQGRAPAQRPMNHVLNESSVLYSFSNALKVIEIGNGIMFTETVTHYTNQDQLMG